MKKFAITCVLFIGLLPVSFASVSFIMPHLTGPSGTQITVPVKVKDFQDIISIQGTIEFDPAIVTYSSVQQFGLPGMNASNFGLTMINTGKITFSWFEGSFIPQNLADSSTIFSITFHITGSSGQTSMLGFSEVPTPVLVTNSSFVEEPALKNHGSITVQSMANPTDITFYMDSISGLPGTQQAISVRALDFININSVQGTIQFDPAVATYAGISHFGLPGMSAGNFGTNFISTGKLTYSWNDPNLTGIDLADSSAIFTMLFTLSGNPGTQTPVEFAATPTLFEVTDSLYNVLNAATYPGRLGIINQPSSTGILVYCDTVSGVFGSQVQVSMYAEHFTNIISMQGTLEFNTAVAAFDNIVQFGLPDMTIANFGLSLTGSGKLMYSWNDPLLAGVSVAGNTPLFVMQFTITGVPGTHTPVDFINMPTPQETVDNGFNVLNDTLVPGLINVTGANSISIADPSPLEYCTGATISVPFTITGVYNPGNLFILQLSDGSGNFSSPMNLDTIAGTTAGTFVCTIPLALIPSANYRIRVTATDPPAQSAVNPSNITINGAPGTAMTIMGNATVCSGSPENYSVSQVAGATSYTWTLPAGWSGISTTEVINTITGTTGGDITVTANNSCGSSAPAIMPVTVSITPSDPGPFSGPDTVCPGSQNTFSVPVVSGLTYVWVVPSGWTIFSGQGTHSIMASAASFPTSASICVYAADGNCNSQQSCFNVAIVAGPPAPGSISGNINVCPGSVNTYSINPVGGAVSYTWTLPSGWAGASTSTSIVATAGSTGGSISVVAHNAYCPSAPQTLNVTVHTPTPPVITINMSTLTSNYPGGNQWFFNGDTMHGANGQNYVVTQNGQYFVIYTDAYGCWASSDTIDFVWVGMPQTLTSEDFTVYPNPSSGRVNFLWNGAAQQEIRITVFSMTGNLVYARDLFVTQQPATVSIDLSGAAPGVYLIKAVTNDAAVNRKLIIE